MDETTCCYMGVVKLLCFCAEGLAPGAPAADVRPLYWMEASKSGDLWLFFKEGFLLASHGFGSLLVL